jgi:hypothetical protein
MLHVVGFAISVVILVAGTIWLTAGLVTLIARVVYGRTGPPDDGKVLHSFVWWCRVIWVLSP